MTRTGIDQPGLYSRTPDTKDFSHIFLPGADWRLEAGTVVHMYACADGPAFSETVVVKESGGQALTKSPRQALKMP